MALLRLEHEIWEFTRGYSASPALGKRIVIYGGSGNGKTHIARAVHRWANKIAMNLPTVPTGSGTQMKLADSVFVHWPTVVDNFKQGDWDLQDLVDASLRVIDDIGAEHDPSGVGKQKLYSVLEHTERKWSIITTNFGPAEWETKFEVRTADRLFRNAIHFDLSDVPSFSAK